MNFKNMLNERNRTQASLMVQWFGVHLPIQGT